MVKKAWPTTLDTAADLAGFLRRRIEQAGGKLRAFKTAERYMWDILSDWGDPYEIAMVYDKVIETHGAVEEVWSLLDLRAYVRFRRQFAPLQGVAYYAYQATFGASGPEKAQMFDLVEALEDAIVAQDTTEAQRRRKSLDELIRRVRDQS